MTREEAVSQMRELNFAGCHDKPECDVAVELFMRLREAVQSQDKVCRWTAIDMYTVESGCGTKFGASFAEKVLLVANVCLMCGGRIAREGEK